MPPQTAINPSHCRVFSEEQLAIALDTTFVSNFLRQSQPGTPKSTRARAHRPLAPVGLLGLGRTQKRKRSGGGRVLRNVRSVEWKRYVNLVHGTNCSMGRT